MQWFLGIDVGKDNLVTALRDEQMHYQNAVFANDPKGFGRLLHWLLKVTKRQPVHVCLEATGRYSHKIFCFLHGQGYVVSSINPQMSANYRRVVGQVHKNDQSDAKLLADFCATQSPEPSVPPSPQQEEVRELSRYLESLEKERTALNNRLKSDPSSEWVCRNLRQRLKMLDRHIQNAKDELDKVAEQDPPTYSQIQLIESISGIGRLTATRLTAEAGLFSRFPKADQLVSYSGLVPKEHASGSSVHRRATLSKSGNSHLRTALYMCALSACRFNPLIRRFADRLEARGKSKMTIIVAVMRKLLVLAYGVVTSGRPFDPNYIPLTAT